MADSLHIEGVRACFHWISCFWLFINVLALYGVPCVHSSGHNSVCLHVCLWYGIFVLPPPTQTNHNFIKAVTPHLVPVLLQQLTKQEEGQEQDDTAWNLAMASGTCLGLLARTSQVSNKHYGRCSLSCWYCPFSFHSCL